MKFKTSDSYFKEEKLFVQLQEINLVSSGFKWVYWYVWMSICKQRRERVLGDPAAEEVADTDYVFRSGVNQTDIHPCQNRKIIIQ